MPQRVCFGQLSRAEIVIGSYKVFRGANRYLNSLGKSHIFDVQLVGLTEHSDLYGGRFSILMF